MAEWEGEIGREGADRSSSSNSRKSTLPTGARSLGSGPPERGLGKGVVRMCDGCDRELRRGEVGCGTVVIDVMMMGWTYVRDGLAMGGHVGSEDVSLRRNGGRIAFMLSR